MTRRCDVSNLASALVLVPARFKSLALSVVSGAVKLQVELESIDSDPPTLMVGLLVSSRTNALVSRVESSMETLR